MSDSGALDEDAKLAEDASRFEDEGGPIIDREHAEKRKKRRQMSVEARLDEIQETLDRIERRLP